MKEQREELLDRLAEEGVDLPALAETLSLTDVDPLDLLLHVAFGEDVVTHSERVKRLYHNHADFFKGYTPDARVIFDVILKKYVDGEAKDVSDTGLLKVPPLSERGTFIELVQSFGGGTNLRNALKEMQRLLY